MRNSAKYSADLAGPQFDGGDNLSESIWRCPKCRGGLQPLDASLNCGTCSLQFDTFGGIPDFRLPGASWVDYEADRSAARRLLARGESARAEELVRLVFSSRPNWDESRVELRTSGVMTAAARLRAEFQDWLEPSIKCDGPLLDLGCGPGALIAAAGRSNCVGIDVSMEWLVVAQRLIAESGGTPLLAAALGEALPLADNSVAGVLSLDVIEHVADPAPYLREISRVTRQAGFLALSTPNRFSLTAEPHVQVWGVGWLPRAVQKKYVKLRSGKSYEYVRLLSSSELRRLLRACTTFNFAILVPKVPVQNIARFRPHRALLARLYNRVAGFKLLRPVFLMIAPFFQVVGRKR